MDEVILGDALNIGLSGVLQGTHEAKFHLLIDKKKAAQRGVVAEENKTQAAAARIQAERRHLFQVP